MQMEANASNACNFGWKSAIHSCQEMLHGMQFLLLIQEQSGRDLHSGKWMQCKEHLMSYAQLHSQHAHVHDMQTQHSQLDVSQALH